MVALTGRQIKKNVRPNKMARSLGASYGHDVLVDEQGPAFEKIVGQGLTAFGSGMNSPMSDLLATGEGLYPFGSGVMTMGNGVVPFGMGLVSKLKGFFKKTHSTIKGAIPAELRRSAMDYGKKKARELLPKVVAKVKEEIAKQAPDVATRLTAPLMKKVPDEYEDMVEGYVKKGTQKGLSLVDKGLDLAEQRALTALGGARMRSLMGSGMASNRGDLIDQLVPLPNATSNPIEYNQRQLNFMKQQGMDLQRQREAGNVPKRLILDQHSRSLLDTIMADKGFERAQKQEYREQLGLMQKPSSTEQMSPYANIKLPTPPKKKAGRPKGTTRGKGVVKL